MRFLSPPADPERAAKMARRRSHPYWRWWAKPGLVLAPVCALALGAVYAHASGADHRALEAARVRLLALTASAGLAVDDVVVEGRSRIAPGAILDALGVRRGSPILAVDPAAAKARLEAMPWVRAASVTRLLPNLLRVSLVERVPMALWRRGDRLELVDRDGVVLPTARAGEFSSLIQLVGDDAPREGAALLELLATEPALAPHVTAAIRVGGRRWNLDLDDGISVELPELNPLAAWRELARLDRTAGLLRRDIKRVDLRFGGHMVLETVPAPTPAKSRKKSAGRNT